MGLGLKLYTFFGSGTKLGDFMLGVLCQAQFKLGLAKLVVATQLDCSARHSQVSLLSLVKAESAQLQLKLGLSLARIHRWW